MHDFNRFKTLHNSIQPLLLTNIWDAASAALVQSNGAPALATSSASLAWSCGYADGSTLPTDELLHSIRSIKQIATVPLSVDIEDGYSKNPTDVADLVWRLASVGVVGINIEDGAGSPARLIDKIKAIRDVTGSDFFINARTDVYLRSISKGEAAFDEALGRLTSYAESGADCGFVPGVSDSQLAKRLSDSLSLPVNLMTNNLDSDVAEFEHCNIARFSLGPNSFLNAYAQLLPSTYDLDYTKMNSLFI